MLRSMSLAGACVLLLFAGCEQNSGNLPAVTQNSDNQSQVVLHGDQYVDAAADRTKKANEFDVTVTTDTYGAKIFLKNAETDEELHSAELKQGELEASFTVPRGQNVYAEVAAFDRKDQSVPCKVVAEQKIDLPFGLLEGPDFRELIKSATCLVKLPDGGFGSGFLFGDRNTIVTAAHCVAAQNVADLEYTFFPDEAREVTYKGARLVFFDRKQDVAVLRLPEPVADDHFWLWSSGSAKIGDEVVVMGNPGRNGEYDPMYARTCRVAAVRPDELRLDVEIYPGYSGGPVVLDRTSKMLGIVSYKVIRSSNYKEIGYSFARSGDIAADAYEQWNSLDSEELQEKHIERVEDRFRQDYGRNLANTTASAYYGDSAVYTVICMSLLADYRVHMLEKMRAPLSGLTTSQRRIVMRKAHEEYIEEIAPDIADKVKERVSPQLRASNIEQDHDDILADESVSESVKESLKKAREGYLELKEAAETIVTNKRGSKDRSAEEFEEYILELWDDVRFHSEEVIQATATL